MIHKETGLFLHIKAEEQLDPLILDVCWSSLSNEVFAGDPFGDTVIC